MSELPCILESEHALVVHWAIDPRVCLADQDERVLTGVGSRRRRPDAAAAWEPPWVCEYHGPKPVVFGHQTLERRFISDLAINLGAHCVYGQHLYGIVFPGKRVYAVKAKRDYWASLKKEAHGIVASLRDHVGSAPFPKVRFETLEKAIREGAASRQAEEIYARASNLPGQRILLVLDLDETLVYGTERPIERPPDLELASFAIYKRPHVDAFLAASFAKFDVAIWSSASADYVQAIARALVPGPERLVFVWSSKQCTYHYDMDLRDYHWIKKLRKIRDRFRYPLERVLIVEDQPSKCEKNYGNAIYVRPFEGDLADDELGLLSRYLATLANVPNVRTIEKRGWRDWVVNGSRG
jgi:RNA polymerase II subunit A small phosphatase-like protein